MANTPNINLNLPANGSFGWDVPTNANWATVDSAFGGTSVPKINPAILQVNGSTGLTGITGTGTSVVTNTSPTIATPIISGIITSLNGTTSVSNSVPLESAIVSLTAQAAAIGTTTLFAVVTAGQYRVSWNAKVTQVATTSSQLGALSIGYTDVDGSAQLCVALGQDGVSVFTTQLTTNVLQTRLLGAPMMLNVKAATNITYQFGYASVGATPMQYNLNIICERM